MENFLFLGVPILKHIRVCLIISGHLGYHISKVYGYSKIGRKFYVPKDDKADLCLG